GCRGRSGTPFLRPVHMDDLFRVTDQAVTPLQIGELVARRLGGDAQLPPLALDFQRHSGIKHPVEELVDVLAQLRYGHGESLLMSSSRLTRSRTIVKGSVVRLVRQGRRSRPRVAPILHKPPPSRG